MKFLIVLSIALACAAADRSDILKNEAKAEIIKDEGSSKPDGSWDFTLETQNGIFGQAHGYQKDAGSETPINVHEGLFRYTDDDGVLHERSFIADENGVQWQGNDLPVGPPTPQHVLDSLDFISKHPPQTTP